MRPQDWKHTYASSWRVVIPQALPHLVSIVAQEVPLGSGLALPLGAGLPGLAAGGVIHVEQERPALLRHRSSSGREGLYVYARLRGRVPDDLAEGQRLQAVVWCRAPRVVPTQQESEPSYVMSGWTLSGKVLEMAQDALVVDAGFPVVVGVRASGPEVGVGDRVSLNPHEITAHVLRLA